MDRHIGSSPHTHLGNSPEGGGLWEGELSTPLQNLGPFQPLLVAIPARLLASFGLAGVALPTVTLQRTHTLAVGIGGYGHSGGCVLVVSQQCLRID